MNDESTVSESQGHRLAAATIKGIRKRLGLTQQALAQSLGISTKAVQSYEQGWREVPGRVAMQALVLFAVHCRSYEDDTPCWEIKDCSLVERQACTSYTLGNGRFCWFLTARMARPDSSDPDLDMQQCLQCQVVEQLLKRRTAATRKSELTPAL